MTNPSNNKLKNLENKLRFLTLTYISIIDNAIFQIAEDNPKYNKDKKTIFLEPVIL